MHRIDEVVAQLGRTTAPTARPRSSRTPADPHEIVLRGRSTPLPAAVHEAGIRMAAVVIVGPALAAEHFPDSHLYSDTRCRN